MSEHIVPLKGIVTNSVCPHCGAILNGTAVQVVCQQCMRGDVALYTLHIGGQTMTLCLDCVQRRLTFRQVGPSEVKHVGVNPYD